MRVGIVGASGYTGLELLRLVLRHPELELVAATSEQRAGQAVGGGGDPLPALKLTLLWYCLHYQMTFTLLITNILFTTLLYLLQVYFDFYCLPLLHYLLICIFNFNKCSFTISVKVFSYFPNK